MRSLQLGKAVKVQHRSSGFGYLVVIEGASGDRFLYAHLSRTLVKRGEWVFPGKLIGRVGSTGSSTGPHLHYGKYRNGVVENPGSICWGRM